MIRRELHIATIQNNIQENRDTNKFIEVVVVALYYVPIKILTSLIFSITPIEIRSLQISMISSEKKTKKHVWNRRVF